MTVLGFDQLYQIALPVGAPGTCAAYTDAPQSGLLFLGKWNPVGGLDPQPRLGLALRFGLPVAVADARPLRQIGSPAKGLSTLTRPHVIVVEPAERSCGTVPSTGHLQAGCAVGQVDDVSCRHLVGVEPQLAHGDLERRPECAEPLPQGAVFADHIRDGVDAVQHGLLDKVGQQLSVPICLGGSGAPHALSCPRCQDRLDGVAVHKGPRLDLVDQPLVDGRGQQSVKTQMRAHLVQELGPARPFLDAVRD